MIPLYFYNVTLTVLYEVDLGFIWIVEVKRVCVSECVCVFKIETEDHLEVYRWERKQMGEPSQHPHEHDPGLLFTASFKE